MKTNELNHKLYLYKPSGADSDFLGELLVDNLQVDIRLHDISNISFTIPRVINGIPNPRIDQVLDNYIVELHYGRIDETYPNDYFKMRFVIYKTPMDFSDTKFIHSYQGSSTESLLEFKLINNWPGVEVYDFFRTITYNRATNNFTEGATTYTNQESNAATGQRYIRLSPVRPGGVDTVYPLDIFLYEIRKKIVVGEEVETKNALIQFDYAGKTYTHADFKVGYYYLSLNGDGTVQYIYIALPDNDVTYNTTTNNYLYNTFTSDYTFSYRLYDNPITKTYAIGPNSTDEANPLNDMYIDLATEADQGDLTPEYGTPQISYNSQKIYSKNGLTLRQILTGKTLESATTANKDGLLYDTDYTIGTIHADIEDLYRSNLQFNNITRLQAIKQVAESFKAFIVFDTIAKTMSFYPENEYGTNKGLILRYASYLKSLNKEVDSSKIITLATAIGKDKTTLNLINPTGKSYWEDYAYFLDSYFINTDDNDILTLISGGNLTLSIESKRFKTDDRIDTSITHNALKVLYTGSTANFTNRWFSTTAQAKALGEWQFARDLYHEIMLGNIEPATDLDVSLLFLQRYYDLYNLRDARIKNYVKLETQLAEYEASMYKAKYLYEYYKKEWDELTAAQQSTAISSGSQTWLSYNKYRLEFTAKTIELETFKTDILNPIKDDLFGTTTNPYGAADSTFRRFLEVQSALHRQSTATDSGLTTCLYVINPIESLNNFKRNAVNNDSSIDNELELLKSTKIYLDENKYPKITVNVDTASLISAEEARQDWNKSFIGDKLYVFLPELNVDLEVQVREVSIDFESNSMSLTISNVRNYNRTFGKFITKIVRNLYNANQNITTYYQDQYNEGSKRANEDAAERKEGQRYESTNKVATGAEDINNGKSSVEVTGAGIESSSIDSVDEATQTFTLTDKILKGFSNVNGSLVAFYDRGTGSFKTEVEISGDNGIIIKKIDNTTNITTKQMYIDTNGNASFAGNLVAPSGDIGGFTIGADFIRAGADNTKLLLKYDTTNPYISIGQATNGYNKEGIFLGLDSSTEKFSILDSTLISEITFQEAFTSGSTLNILNGAGTWTTDAAVYNAVGVSPTDGFFNIEDGLTTSVNTGPDSPYEGNRFLYYESSGTSSLNRDLIFTYTTTSTQLHYISFYYHMFGGSTTSLTLFRNGTTEILWRKTGNQGNKWYEATVPVITGTTTLRFRVVGDGSSFTSDIALDHIRIYSTLNKFSYDPNLGLSLIGDITATSGEIGGFDIGTNQLTAGFSTTRVGISDGSTTSNVSIYAGSETATSAPFRVTNAGAVTMTNLDAQGGTIAGWSIVNETSIRIKSPVGIFDDGGGTFYYSTTALGNGWLGSADTDSNGTIISTTPFFYIHPNYGFSYKVGTNPLSGTPTVSYGAFGIYNRSSSGTFDINTENTTLQIVTDNNPILLQSGLVSSNQNINLVVNGTGRVRWSINGGSTYTSAQQGTGTTWSSKIIKKDITSLSQTDIQGFIDKIEIKQFKYKENDKIGISLIVEDEIDKNIPLKDILFKRDESGITYTSLEAIPEHLKEYINTENFTYNQELNEYTFRPMAYDSTVMLSIAIAVIKKQNNDIKELKKDIALIKNKLGI